MAKAIGNPIEIRIEIHNGETPDLHWVKGCYTVTCEHEIDECRMLVCELTAEVITACTDLLEEVAGQIDTEEGT